MLTLMSRGRGTLQRSLLELINANGRLDTFALTALAYELEPDEQGNVLVSEAHLASVRRALGVLLREGRVIGSTARRQCGRSAWAAPEHAGRLWFWIECDDAEGREPFGWDDDGHAVSDRDTGMNSGSADTLGEARAPAVPLRWPWLRR